MTRTLQFTKMHGIGNDYIYVNCLEHPLDRPEEAAIRLSHRHFGVGSDGLVLILPSATADFQMRMFNADGSESEMCGNAVRCIAKYVYEKGLTTKKVIELDTKGGKKILELTLSGETVTSVRVDMGEPILKGSLVPIAIDANPVLNHPLDIGGIQLRMTCVSMGNPHAVFFVEEITDDLVLRIGPMIEKHPLFPRRTNVEFVQVLSPTELRMRVWERGSGETLACGTGAAAVLVAAVLNELTERKAKIHLLGGDLEIEWAANNHVYKTGPAAYSFEGTVELP